MINLGVNERKETHNTDTTYKKMYRQSITHMGHQHLTYVHLKHVCTINITTTHCTVRQHYGGTVHYRFPNFSRHVFPFPITKTTATTTTIGHLAQPLPLLLYSTIPTSPIHNNALHYNVSIILLYFGLEEIEGWGRRWCMDGEDRRENNHEGNRCEYMMDSWKIERELRGWPGGWQLL